MVGFLLLFPFSKLFSFSLHQEFFLITISTFFPASAVFRSQLQFIPYTSFKLVELTSTHLEFILLRSLTDAHGNHPNRNLTTVSSKNLGAIDILSQTISHRRPFFSNRQSHIAFDMQIILLFVAFFTATAFAEHHHVAHPQRFHHRRALNATSDDADPSTTLTISVTSVRTVLGCPTTKTDCPLATHPISIVTDIIAVYTTVCPLTDAQSISASVASSGTLVAHTSPTVEVPLSTGALAAVSGAGSSSTADATLTYVLGTGTSKVTITTTIKNYKTKTDYVVGEITNVTLYCTNFP